MSEDVLNRIAEWCKADPTLTFKTFKTKGPAIDVAGTPKIRLGVDVGEDQVVLSHEVTVPGAGEAEASQARSLFNQRGSLLRGSAEADAEGLKVEAWYEIFLEGLNRQTFLIGVNELASAIDTVMPAVVEEVPAVVEEVPAVVEEAPVAIEEPAAVSSEEMIDEAYAAFIPTHEVPAGGMRAWAKPDPQLTPVAELAARVQLRVDETRGAWAKVTGENGWTGWVDARQLTALAGAAIKVAAKPVVQPEPVTQPLPTVQVQAAPVWTATHEVPAGGLSAWEQPDPQLQPVTTLSERVQLRVDEMRGAWAKVTAENGWTAWVDGRQLKKKGGGGGRAMAMGGLALRPLPLIAGVLLIVSTFIDWVQAILSGPGANSWDVPLPFLWDYKSLAEFDLGWLLVVLGLAALAIGIVPGKVRGYTGLIGVLAIVIVLVFVIQLSRWASFYFGAGFGDVMQNAVSAGPYLALGGGVLLLIGAFLKE